MIFFEKPWFNLLNILHFSLLHQFVMHNGDAAVDTLVSDVDGFRRQKIGRHLLEMYTVHLNTLYSSLYLTSFCKVGGGTSVIRGTEGGGAR